MSTVILSAAIANSGTMVNVEFIVEGNYETESLFVTLLMPPGMDVRTTITDNKKEIIALSIVPASHFTVEDFDEGEFKINGSCPVILGDAAESIQILMSKVHYSQAW